MTKMKYFCPTVYQIYQISGEGNGNPLQCSCLENPMDRGAWWATVHRIAKSQTRLSGYSYLLTYLLTPDMGFPGGASGKEPTCQCRRHMRCGFDPWVRKTSWWRAWQPTSVLLPGESHGQRSLASYDP